MVFFATTLVRSDRVLNIMTLSTCVCFMFVKHDIKEVFKHVGVELCTSPAQTATDTLAISITDIDAKPNSTVIIL
jgi:hypothetical protein